MSTHSPRDRAASIWVSAHLWCGFGVSGGLFPEIRLGVIAVGCCRGAIGAIARGARARAEQALAALILRRP